MTDKRIFDDLSELAGGAIGLFANLRDQMAQDAREKMEMFTQKLDLPSRAEFDKLQGMVTKLRQVQEELGKRLTALEGSGAKKPTLKSTPKPATAKKSPAAKKPTAKKKK